MQVEATCITQLVTQTLETLEVPYAVGGSLASSVHGVMRFTLDVDIVADMRLEHSQTRMVPYGRRSLRPPMARQAVGVGVLKTREGELDLGYLRKWAKELNVNDLLEPALKESS